MGGGGNNLDFWGRLGIAVVVQTAWPYALIASAGLLIWMVR